MEKKIIWSLESEPIKFSPSEGIFTEGEEEIDEDEDRSNLLDRLHDGIELRRIIQTSLGNFILDDALSPFHHLYFWRFDTNFNITKSVERAIEETPGVDILKILTRYAGILSVGKAFDIRDVRVTIEEKLCGRKLTTSVEDDSLMKLKKELSEYEDYAIFRFPNGNLDYVILEKDKSNQSEFNDKVKFFLEAKQLSNGVIIRNNE